MWELGDVASKAAPASKDLWGMQEEGWKIVLRSMMLAGMLLIPFLAGCVSTTPRNLVDRNDHAGLAVWYQEEAARLRARAEEMRQVAKQYERRMTKPQQRSVLIQHYRNLAERYEKAAEDAEALGKLHAEQQ
ncbi:MAG: hypothetical protein D6704_08620 [Nitrospirae bacterium]|nr:MAG: hypothetical protein D6704_08620 [Nitrospirota bacterium]